MAYTRQITEVRITGTNFRVGNITNYAVAGTGNVSTGTNRITLTSTPPANGTLLNFKLDSSITSVGGITRGENYYVVDSGGGGGNDIKLSLTSGGSAINLTGVVVGSGGNMFETGASYVIKVQNLEMPFKDVYYSGSSEDEAVNGFLRTNLRGFRFMSSLTWDANTQPNLIRRLMNDIYHDLVGATTPSSSFTISFDDDVTTTAVIPESISYLVKYQNTLNAKLIPSFKLKGVNIVTEIPSLNEAPAL